MNNIDFEQELYNQFGQVKDFTTGMRIAKHFYEMGVKAQVCHESREEPVSDGLDKDQIPDTADKGFTNWWDMYAKKIDRQKCLRKWLKLTNAERMACMAATPAYVASTPDLQYRRHPATYLNNKSWENQIIPHNNGTDKSTSNRDKLADILAP